MVEQKTRKRRRPEQISSTVARKTKKKKIENKPFEPRVIQTLKDDRQASGHLFLVQYKRRQRGKKNKIWKTMEDILSTREDLPLKKHLNKKDFEYWVHKIEQEPLSMTLQFEVETIIEERISNQNLEFFVKWKHFSHAYNEWITADSCDCPRLVQEFRAKQSENNNVAILGSRGFGKGYWQKNYADESLPHMDGVANAQEHAAKLKAEFDLHDVTINSIADFGCGLGKLFVAVIDLLTPTFAYGLEPSEYAFNQSVGEFFTVSKKHVDFVWMDHMSVQEFMHQLRKRKMKPHKRVTFANPKPGCPPELTKQPPKIFDLGLFTSVGQYLNDKDFIQIMEMLSRHCKYLYFDVPTSVEYKDMHRNHDFNDVYCISRDPSWYRNIIKKHWVIVSNGILESKNLNVQKKFDRSIFRSAFNECVCQDEEVESKA